MSDEPVAGARPSTTDPDQAPRVRPIRTGPIPQAVSALLLRAHGLERSRSGGDRIAAYELTRALLGGARRAGYTSAQLAECLGLSVGTIRTRDHNDGWLSEATFVEISDLDFSEVRRWRRLGRLPHRTRSDNGDTCYLASELINTLSRPPAQPIRRRTSA